MRAILRLILGERSRRKRIPLLYKHLRSSSSIYGTPPPEASPTIRTLILARVAADEATAWRLLCRHGDLGYEEIIKLYRKKRTRKPRLGKIIRKVWEAMWQ